MHYIDARSAKMTPAKIVPVAPARRINILNDMSMHINFSARQRLPKFAGWGMSISRRAVRRAAEGLALKRTSRKTSSGCRRNCS